MRVQLTDRFVATTKIDSVQAEFFDTKVKGLSLRVSRSGARRWHFHYTGADGKRARASLGTYPATPLGAARAAAVEARSALEAGDDPRAGKLKASTVATLIDSYLTKRVLPTLRGADRVKRRLYGNVSTMIGDVRLADLVMFQLKPTERLRICGPCFGGRRNEGISTMTRLSACRCRQRCAPGRAFSMTTKLNAFGTQNLRRSISRGCLSWQF
jgi:hypothetical protein